MTQLAAIKTFAEVTSVEKRAWLETLPNIPRAALTTHARKLICEVQSQDLFGLEHAKGAIWLL